MPTAAIAAVNQDASERPGYRRRSSRGSPRPRLLNAGMGLSDPGGEHPVTQLNLPNFTTALHVAVPDDAEARGAVFTKPEVVNFILDLCGYTQKSPLRQSRLLEPGCGNGDFLVPAVTRLLDAARRRGVPAERLEDAVCGVELHAASLDVARGRLGVLLGEHDVEPPTRQRLLDAWLVCGDFLLEPFQKRFTHVAGNPPYVRQEMIPEPLVAEYRKRYKTIYDRADLYVPFVEQSLQLPDAGGKSGMICSDRWMKNRYGGPLRRMVAEDYHLGIYVDMTDTEAFHSDVIAYPAITVIERPAPGTPADPDAARVPGTTRVAHRPNVSEPELSRLSVHLLSPETPPAGSGVQDAQGVAAGADPWILECFDQLGVMRRLERDFPLLEETGCKVGIGVATGADAAFIAPYDELAVEDDRKLPLVTTRDIESGDVRWRGLRRRQPLRRTRQAGAAGGVPPARRLPRAAPRPDRRPARGPQAPRRLVPDHRPHHARAGPDTQAPHPRHQGRGARRLRGGESSTRTTTSTTSPRSPGTCARCRPCWRRTSAGCSSPCTRSRCAGATSASRRSTCAVSACPSGTTCRSSSAPP